MGIFSYTESIMYVYMKYNGHSLHNFSDRLTVKQQWNTSIDRFRWVLLLEVYFYYSIQLFIRKKRVALGNYYFFRHRELLWCYLRLPLANQLHLHLHSWHEHESRDSIILDAWSKFLQSSSITWQSFMSCKHIFLL